MSNNELVFEYVNNLFYISTKIGSWCLSGDGHDRDFVHIDFCNITYDTYHIKKEKMLSNELINLTLYKVNHKFKMIIHESYIKNDTEMIVILKNEIELREAKIIKLLNGCI